MIPHELSCNSSWSYLGLDPRDPLTHAHLESLFEMQMAGVNLRHVVPLGICGQAAAAFHAQCAPQAYAGNLAIGIGGSAWEVRFEKGDTAEAWFAYRKRIVEWDEERKRVLGPVFGFDPLEILVGILRGAWQGGEVRRAINARVGVELYAGLVRGGVPDPHIDDARRHVPIASRGHLGMVLVLDAMPGSYQRCWQATWEGYHANGDYPVKEPEAPFVDIPTLVGSVSLLSARNVHKVVDDARRLTLALHVARLGNGDLVYYS